MKLFRIQLNKLRKEVNIVNINKLSIKTIVGMVCLAAVAALGVRVFAQSVTPTYYTGCLAGDGKLSEVAVGTTPVSPCKENKTQVSWSNGDILGVLAGTGLTGGGMSGEVTLAADTNYLQKRITGSCPTGSAINSVDTEGGVGCQPAGNAISTAERIPFPQAAIQTPLSGYTDLPGMTFTRTTDDSNAFILVNGFARGACDSSALRFALFRDGFVVQESLVSPVPSGGVNYGGWASYTLTDVGALTAGTHTWAVKAFFLNYGTAPTCELVTYADASYLNFKR